MPNVLYVVTVDVAPASAAVWDVWHTRHHMPDVLRQPGFINGRKFCEPTPLTDGWLRYVVLYELDSPASMAAYQSSDAARRIRDDHNARFGDVTRVARRVLHEVSVVMARDPYRDPYEGI